MPPGGGRQGAATDGGVAESAVTGGGTAESTVGTAGSTGGAVANGQAGPGQAPGRVGVKAGPGSPPGARRSISGWLRWAWRQLTSMRTALVLLFLLAVASVPGSVIPQQGIDPAAVAQYYTAHPALAPIKCSRAGLDRQILQ